MNYYYKYKKIHQMTFSTLHIYVKQITFYLAYWYIIYTYVYNCKSNFIVLPMEPNKM